MKTKTKKNIRKETLQMFIPSVLILAAIIFTITFFKNKSEHTLYWQSEQNIVDVRIADIDNEISHVINDLKILSTSTTLQRYFNEDQKKEAYENLVSDFFSFTKNRKLYDQVRYIDTTGQEIIRINYNNANPVIVANQALQNKAKRYYFTDAIKLNKNNIYISPFDLNIEDGVIETPYKPMIRLAIPVYNEMGIKQGLIVLNYFGGIILKNKLNFKNEVIDNKLMLLNSESYWLKGPTTEHEWAFMFGDKKNLNFQNKYSVEWETISEEFSGQFETENGLFTFKTIYPVKEKLQTSTGSPYANQPSEKQFSSSEYYWKVVSYIPHETLYQQQHKNNLLAIIVFICIAIISFLTAWKIAHYKNMQKLSSFALEESEKKYGLLFSNILQPIWLVNKNGKIVQFNKTAYEVLEYTKEEFENLTIPEIDTSDDINEVKNKIAKLFEFQNLTFETEQKTKSGKIINVVANSTLLKIDFTDIILVSFHDITELRNAEKRLIEKKNALEKSNSTKDTFISILAHDLRSPFSSLKGFSEMLLLDFKNFDKDEIKKMIGYIHTSAKETYNLLDNLLEWSRSQRDSIPFNPYKTSLYPIINETCLLSDFSAKEKNTKIIINVAKDIEADFDTEMMKTVIRNIINNAVKFTENGAITISAINDENNVTIEISDTGTGMTQETIDSLFVIGKTQSKTGTKGEKGTGFGLLLCKEFIDKHNGTIKVQSTKGEGSLFTIQIPIIYSKKQN